MEHKKALEMEEKKKKEKELGLMKMIASYDKEEDVHPFPPS